MTTFLTAQNVFNGSGFDVDHLLRKADRELARLRAARGFEEPYDHMFNFAVTLAAICDWTFHVHLRSLPRWTGKKEHHFTNWVRHTSSDAFVFIDISNEYKHANRKVPSALAEKVMLSFIDLGIKPQLRGIVDMSKGWIQKVGTNDWYFCPLIKFGGRSENFYDPAERAISWWKSLSHNGIQPMDINGNVIP